MGLRRISLNRIIFIFACYISFTCAAVSFAKECDMIYNIDCGDSSPYCCLDEHFCSDPDTTHCTDVVGGPRGTCTSIDLFGENSAETQLLRHFRDNFLDKFQEGKELIKLYYQWSPVIVRAMEEDEEFKEEVKELFEGILPMIREELE